MSSAIFNLSSDISNVAAAASPAHNTIMEEPEEHMPVTDDMVTSDEVQLSPRPLCNSTRSTKARRATFQRCLQPSLELLLMGESSCCSSISGINTSLYLNTHLAAALPEPTALLLAQTALAMPKAVRESLDLLAAVKASMCVSLSSLSGINTSLYLNNHQAAAVREPTLLDHLRWMRESLERHLAEGRPEAQPTWCAESGNGDQVTAAALLERRMRESLDLTAALWASCESLSGVDISSYLKEHEAASVPEPSNPAHKQMTPVERMRQSLDLMAALQASCESLSGVDISSYLKEHEAASVPEPEPTTSVPNQRKGALSMAQGVRESLDLLAAFRASVASSISGIDADHFLSSHEAASVPEPAATVPDPSALLVKKMRESLDLLAALRASCQSISGEDIEAFYREHPLAEAAAAESSDSEDAVDTPCTSSGATSCCGTASALLSSSSSSSLVAAAWSVESSCTENVPSCCCPVSAPDQQEQEEQEEAAATALAEEKPAASEPEPEAKAEAESSLARKSRGGCLKRKLHKLRKMMRGVWGSFVNAL